MLTEQEIKGLQQALEIAGIDENEWNLCAPMERKKKYKAKITKARLKFHPDKISNTSVTPEESDEKIRLLTNINYELATDVLEQGFEDTQRARTPEEFFAPFKESLEAFIGTGKKFETWQAAYKHYFEFEDDNPLWDLRGAYGHTITSDPVDYQKEFNDALIEGIYNKFVKAGAYDLLGAGRNCLPPQFRYERELLIQICKHELHKGWEETVISVAAPELLNDESFWRAAIAANPKALYSMHRIPKPKRKVDDSALTSLSLEAILTSDPVLMKSVLERAPRFVHFIDSSLADDDELLLCVVDEEPTVTLKLASKRLRNILQSLAEQALRADSYAIEHIDLDINNTEQIKAYQGWLERVWDDLPQNEPRNPSISDKTRSRKELLNLVDESFKPALTNLHDATEKLIADVEAFISKLERNKHGGEPHVYNLYKDGVFKSIVPGIVTEEEKFGALRMLLHSFLKNPDQGEIRSRLNPKQEELTPEDLYVFSKTPLKHAIEEWMQLKEAVFTANPISYSPESLRAMLERLSNDKRLVEVQKKDSKGNRLLYGCVGNPEALKIILELLPKTARLMVIQDIAQYPLLSDEIKSIIEQEKNASQERTSSVSQYYTHATSLFNHKRYHALTVRAQDFFREEKAYKNLEGDFLKTCILEDFKDALDDVVTTEGLDTLVDRFKASEQYKVLQAAQGLTTKLLGLKTDSIKAFETMVEEKKSNLESGPRNSSV